MTQSDDKPNEDLPAAGERVFYIRDATGQPVGCLAYQAEGEYVRYAASFLHPNDAFDRALARRIALGRLRVNSDEVRLHDGERPLSIALVALAGCGTVPSRVLKILRRGIRRRAQEAGV